MPNSYYDQMLEHQCWVCKKKYRCEHSVPCWPCYDFEVVTVTVVEDKIVDGLQKCAEDRDETGLDQGESDG